MCMKILIAEDEPDIRMAYKTALEARGHEVILAENGDECVSIYLNELERTKKTLTDNNHKDGNKHHKDAPVAYSSSSPLYVFDAVVLDYRMQKKDGIQVAKEILDLNQNQRIIFASGYVMDTFKDSIKQLKKAIELLQKPFSPDILVDVIEDKEAYEALKKLIVDVRDIQQDKRTGYDFTQEQVKSLFDSLRKIQKGRSFVQFFIWGLIMVLCSTN